MTVPNAFVEKDIIKYKLNREIAKNRKDFEHNEYIVKDNLTDLKIDLETCRDVDDFLDSKSVGGAKYMHREELIEKGFKHDEIGKILEYKMWRIYQK